MDLEMEPNVAICKLFENLLILQTTFTCGLFFFFGHFFAAKNLKFFWMNKNMFEKVERSIVPILPLS